MPKQVDIQFFFYSAWGKKLLVLRAMPCSSWEGRLCIYYLAIPTKGPGCYSSDSQESPWQWSCGEARGRTGLHRLGFTDFHFLGKKEVLVRRGAMVWRNDSGRNGLDIWDQWLYFTASKTDLDIWQLCWVCGPQERPWKGKTEEQLFILGRKRICTLTPQIFP